MIKIKVLFLLGFTFITGQLIAQNNEIEITQMTLSNFANKSIIMDMAQDKHGNLWMLHGADGLTRYDGENMRLFSPNLQDPNSISSGRLEILHIDKNGIIWIATLDSGIDRLDPVTEKFTHYRHNPNDPKSLRSDIVRAFVEDEDGFIWVGTNKGLDKLDPKTGEFIHFFSHDPDMEAVNQLHVRTLYVDKSGVLWIGGGSPFSDDLGLGGLFKYDQKRDEISPYLHSPEETSLISDTVSAIFEDSKGVFWVGTAGDGLHTMDRENGTFVRHRYDPKNPNKLSRPALGDIIDYSVDFISFINEDNQGHIWIGTYEGGLNRYDPNSKNITYYGIEQVGGLSCWDFFKTKDGLLWISFWGIDLQKTRLLKINTATGILNYTELGSRVKEIIEISPDEILIGTRDGLMAMDSLGNIHQKVLTSEINFQNTKIDGLAKDPENNLWIATERGAYFYNASNKTVKAYRHTPNNKNSISNDDINVILPIKDQYVLIATDGGLDALNLEDGSIKNYLHKDSLDANYIYELFQDSEGTIWVGIEVDGIKKFDLKSGHFQSYGLKGDISSIFEDSHHQLWISVRKSGLWYYKRDKDEFVPFLDDAGVLGSYYDISNITEDHVGNLWLKTSLGTVKLNLETGATYLMTEEGINIENRNSSAVYTSSRGKVYFGQGTGLIEWDGSKRAQDATHINLPFIDKFYVNNVLVNEGQDETLTDSLSKIQDITLKYFQNSFAFEYGHADFISLPVRHTIQFKLEHYDNYWRMSKGENRAAYVKVPPGEYVFHIRASNPNGIWTSKRIQITILKPWYQTWWAYSLYALLFISVVILFIRWKTKALQKEKTVLEEKVTVRTAELNQSLENLKSTQSQLIQSEKMASLGELTAGIAHEIQNPLNFVNNFSDVSNELLDEMKTEFKKGDTEQGFVIADDIKQNLEKILHHGKRADAIVKGMLQHSRTSSGVKEPTDINVLADEYLRLAFHGLLAKDKTFNAKFTTDFDPTIEAINVAPQEIGRVILNLINNAFYAVSEKSKQNIAGYEPTIWVSTRHVNSPSGVGGSGGKIEIKVKDNGNGIPDSIKEKIFQPFFTTKPTGQGTGLGLSLSYDIIKAHNGDLKVETPPDGRARKEGEGSEFIVLLPGE